ncbi:hypothetical protein P872_11220 [Rhodonellum psychrophilum GCM71 = DSM 17998]|uniref:Uncharacterized protein n=1 Tax=Rhodonellum psychrophilum GCM71 = DSM 17998 TaxID=1123057 RepID=U5BTM7_9BACT|nr:hypothetical protein P872_11220 [Rhodonellum psychrophilum GCM71 = DSM 17998]
MSKNIHLKIKDEILGCNLVFRKIPLSNSVQTIRPAGIAELGQQGNDPPAGDRFKNMDLSQTNETRCIPLLKQSFPEGNASQGSSLSFTRILRTRKSNVENLT